MFGTPAAIQGPQPRPASTTPRSWGARLLDIRRRPARRCGAVRRRRLALEGVPLIDFGQYLAGPFGPMIIGDLGADVIKVEPVTGDGMRMATKPFFGCQRGKRDIALNIKTPAGLAIAHEADRDRRRRAPQHDRAASRRSSASTTRRAKR